MTETITPGAQGLSVAQLELLVGQPLVPDQMGRTGTLASSMSRGGANFGSVGPAVSGRIDLFLKYLPVGMTIASITFQTGSTGITGPQNQWFALYTYHATAPSLLRQTVDNTSTAWGSNTERNLALTSSYTITSSGLYYVGAMTKASGAINNWAGVAITNAVVFNAAPNMAATADTGLTTTAPATATIGGSFLAYPYFDVR